MTCAAFETLLSEYMEGEVDPRTASHMEQHRKLCSQCSRLFDQVAEVRNQLREFPELSVSESLVRRILDQTAGSSSHNFHPWREVLVSFIYPFFSRRFAFATVIIFVFLSLMTNVVSPEFSAFSSSRLGPSTLVEQANRVSNQIYQRWMEFNNWKEGVTEELILLKEDLFGRLDYHLVTMLFRSYNESVQDQASSESEQDQESEEEEQ